MTCHLVRWTSTEALPDLQRLSDDLTSSLPGFSAKRRERYLKSRALLAEAMSHLFGYPALPPLTLSPSGKPCFTHPDLPDFSFAYAGNTLALLLSAEGDVGMDVEIVHQRAGQRLPPLGPSEQAWLDAQRDPLEAAAQLLAIRQAVLKIAGDDERQALKLHPASGRLRFPPLPAVAVISDVDDYLVWACACTPRLDHLLLWRYVPGEGLRQQGEIVQRQRQSRSYMKLASQTAEMVVEKG